ncbi:uncharacterized protein LOC135826499 [Sycon ciliatum]|uniref:uncharacterized protein LOC135826499 n=1 Tax=Sycon ciliatum TaxID=27933 RepID=UPI0031F6DE0A
MESNRAALQATCPFAADVRFFEGSAYSCSCKAGLQFQSRSCVHQISNGNCDSSPLPVDRCRLFPVRVGYVNNTKQFSVLECPTGMSMVPNPCYGYASEGSVLFEANRTCNTLFNAYICVCPGSTKDQPRQLCDAVTCPAPQAPANGSSTATGEALTFVYAQTVEFWCNPGYTVNGSASTSCKADGSWTNPTPYCQAIQEGSVDNVGSTSEPVVLIAASVSVGSVLLAILLFVTHRCTRARCWMPSNRTKLKGNSEHRALHNLVNSSQPRRKRQNTVTSLNTIMDNCDVKGKGNCTDPSCYVNQEGMPHTMSTCDNEMGRYMGDVTAPQSLVLLPGAVSGTERSVDSGVSDMLSFRRRTSSDADAAALGSLTHSATQHAHYHNSSAVPSGGGANDSPGASTPSHKAYQSNAIGTPPQQQQQRNTQSKSANDRRAQNQAAPGRSRTDTFAPVNNERGRSRTCGPILTENIESPEQQRGRLGSVYHTLIGPNHEETVDSEESADCYQELSQVAAALSDVKLRKAARSTPRSTPRGSPSVLRSMTQRTECDVEKPLVRPRVKSFTFMPNQSVDSPSSLRSSNMATIHCCEHKPHQDGDIYDNDTGGEYEAFDRTDLPTSRRPSTAEPLPPLPSMCPASAALNKNIAMTLNDHWPSSATSDSPPVCRAQLQLNGDDMSELYLTANDIIARNSITTDDRPVSPTTIHTSAEASASASRHAISGVPDVQPASSLPRQAPILYDETTCGKGTTEDSTLGRLPVFTGADTCPLCSGLVNEQGRCAGECDVLYGSVSSLAHQLRASEFNAAAVAADADEVYDLAHDA